MLTGRQTVIAKQMPEEPALGAAAASKAGVGPSDPMSPARLLLLGTPGTCVHNRISVHTDRCNSSETLLTSGFISGY